MMGFVLVVLSAAVAGAIHVLAGPDHMAAVAPIAIADRRRSWFAGWTWGLGHAAGVVVVALLAVLLRELLPSVDTLSAWGERLVGGALIAVGVWALRRALAIGAPPHAHQGVPHAHPHVRQGPAVLRRLGHAHAAFAMGILHGVAGTSHFLGVLPALALPTRAAAVTYVGVFGVSTVAAMTVFAAAVGLAAERSALAGPRAHRALSCTGAMFALVIGAVWLAGLGAG
ncbi:MAG: High-affinity nickel transporter [Acidimicrobiia bacterium]|nr:High-affinity nickel transporter [Acidimicrobiia bacterium]